MSRFVVLIRANRLNGHQPFDDNDPRDYYAISVSNNPAVALASLQDYCPLPCELIHSIESGPRTNYLERTLHIKYRAFQLRKDSFWFTLPPQEVEFIKSLNECNFFEQAGFLNKAAIPPAPPVIATAELPDFIANNLELCKELLNE